MARAKNAPQNDTQRIAERRHKVNALYCQGKSQYFIAKVIGVTQACVSKDLSALRDKWAEENSEAVGKRIAVELAKIDNVERTAWEAWDKSCEDAEQTYSRTEEALRIRPGVKVVAGKCPPMDLVPVRVTKNIQRKGQHSAGTWTQPRWVVAKAEANGRGTNRRFGVILRKVWGGSRTWVGARAQSVLMSVWRTCWQQGRAALDFLSQLLRGTPPRPTPTPPDGAGSLLSPRRGEPRGPPSAVL